MLPLAIEFVQLKTCPLVWSDSWVSLDVAVKVVSAPVIVTVVAADA
jgi:hypothetical protein